jgi:hypothetical protein
MILHVTNGDVFAMRISSLGIPGIILPWREILHEGDLLPYQNYSESGRKAFNTSRARFIESAGWGTQKETLFEMTQRDELLLAQHWDEITLWFERDLYDQSLMAHVLSLLSGAGVLREPGLTLVYSDQHLDKLSDLELNNRYARRTLIDKPLADHYSEFFSGMIGGSATPKKSAPQALRDAAVRLDELKPEPSGLSFFDRRIIALVKSEGEISVDELFKLVTDQDGDDAFWGDTAFTRRVMDLIKRCEDLKIINGRVS